MEVHRHVRLCLRLSLTFCPSITPSTFTMACLPCPPPPLAIRTMVVLHCRLLNLSAKAPSYLSRDSRRSAAHKRVSCSLVRRCCCCCQSRCYVADAFYHKRKVCFFKRAIVSSTPDRSDLGTAALVYGNKSEAVTKECFSSLWLPCFSTKGVPW